MNRRRLLLSAACAPVLGGLGFPADAAPVRIGAGDRVLGAATAPIAVIDYSSLTCPHCARFHNETLPRVKEEWIRPGRVRLAYRHFPLDGLALRAAILADAMGDTTAFFAFVGVLFETQARWLRAGDPLEAVVSLALDAGMSRARAEEALQSGAAMRAVLERVVEARDAFGVNSTPTFIINGRKLVGVTDYGKLAEALETAAAG